MSTALFVYTKQKLALGDALAAFAAINQSHDATAMLYSPKWCELATFDERGLRDSDGQPVDTSHVFEARVFHEKAELRWLNDPSREQCHQAVILSEEQSAKPLDGWHCETRKDVIDKLNQTYLLWGEGTGRLMKNGWSELAMARIGALTVPVGNVGKNQRVLLQSVEYIVEADYGNAVVFDERLMKWEVAHG